MVAYQTTTSRLLGDYSSAVEIEPVLRAALAAPAAAIESASRVALAYGSTSTAVAVIYGSTLTTAPAGLPVATEATLAATLAANYQD